MSLQHTSGLIAICAVLAGACGRDEERPAQATPKAPALPAASVVDKDPYAITCGHVRDQLEWSQLTRRATVAIADRESLPGLNRLRATQSLFFAMTELCKGRDAGHRPAAAAVEAVRDGRYVANLESP